MIQKQTVCIASEDTKKEGYNVPKGFIGKYGYFFTPEQLNEYTANVIKQALETGAEKAEPNILNKCAKNPKFTIVDVDKKSITNTFEETYEKLKV